MNLSNAAIAKQWHLLLPACSQEGPAFLSSVEKHVEAAGVPGLRCSQQSVATSLLKSFRGKRRDALVVTYRALPEWHIVVLVHSWGTSLHVSWFAVVTRTIRRDIRRAFRFGEKRAVGQVIGSELDTFDLLDWSAVTSLTRDAVNAAIEELLPGHEIPVEGSPRDSFDESR